MEGSLSQWLMTKGVRKEKRMRWVVDAVQDQDRFDELFALLFHHERSLILRVAEAIEKVTLANPHFLAPHKDQVLALLTSEDHKELKKHVIKLVPRLPLNADELDAIWKTTSYWAKNPNEHKTIRANALQTLYELSKRNPAHMTDLHQTLHDVARKPVPSIQAKLRKLRRQTKAPIQDIQI